VSVRIAADIPLAKTPEELVGRATAYASLTFDLEEKFL